MGIEELQDADIVNAALDYLGEEEGPLDYAIGESQIELILADGRDVFVQFEDLDFEAPTETQEEEALEEPSPPTDLAEDDPRLEQGSAADLTKEDPKPDVVGPETNAAAEEEGGFAQDEELEFALERLLDEAGVNADQIATLREAFGSLVQLTEVDLNKSALTDLSGIGDATAEKILNALTDSGA